MMNLTKILIIKFININSLLQQYISCWVNVILALGKYHKQWSNLNPLRAKFYRGNINIYLHFMSFLHIDLTQVLKILPQVREGRTYSI